MTATAPPPAAAVLRLSRGTFDPARHAEVAAMIDRTAAYLVPAIRALPGLLSYHAATSPAGWTVQVSVWTSAEAGSAMSRLPEMRDRALAEALALGIAFEPIVQVPIQWSVPPAGTP
jgi:quinol monooxygenase YgiN